MDLDTSFRSKFDGCSAGSKCLGKLAYLLIVLQMHILVVSHLSHCEDGKFVVSGFWVRFCFKDFGNIFKFEEENGDLVITCSPHHLHFYDRLFYALEARKTFI